MGLQMFLDGILVWSVFLSQSPPLMGGVEMGGKLIRVVARVWGLRSSTEVAEEKRGREYGIIKLAIEPSSFPAAMPGGQSIKRSI